MYRYASVVRPRLRTLESVMNAVFDGAYFVDNQRKILAWNEGAFFISGYRER